MFEKKAEEIANKKLCSERICYNHCNFNSPKHHRCGEWHRIYECAKESAEFGYNKANEWHYIAEEGLPEAGKYYFIAYQTALGLSGAYCKLVEKTRPIINILENTITGYETTKMWDCEDSEVKAWMNERGRVYAWKFLPDLPEYREYR